MDELDAVDVCRTVAAERRSLRGGLVGMAPQIEAAGGTVA